MVRGRTPDLSWRLMDAQYWASPRLARRQRIFLVADFGGRRSHEILFKPRTMQSLFAFGGDCGLPAACGDRGSFIEAGRRVPVTRPFQAIVCTHPDGHNHSGNIHVHIVINSLRIEEVPLLPYMDRPADTRAGCKHRCTDAAMEYFKAEVMEMCHRENLYQIDLLHGSKNRITEREYWAQKKGQAKLDKENATLAAEGQPVKQTKFETDKAKLRQTIRNAMSEATTFDEFSALLLRQGVIVKESRGRLSYLTPDRTKPITARKLGGDFDRAAVLALLEQNAHRAAEKTAPIPEYHTAETNRTERGKTQKIAPTGNIQRMVDRAAKRAEGKGIGYDRWAAVHNLKQMAATVAAMEQYGFTPDELDAALVSANADLHSSTAKLKPIETAMSFTIQF